MSVKDIYNQLIKARRPIDFFGNVLSEKELKKIYHNYGKKIHPDIVSPSDKYIASEAFKILNKLYNLGVTELSQKIYDVFDTTKLYEHCNPLFEINISGENFKFYENVFEGEVGNIFKGISAGNPIYLKIAIDSADNNLINTEYDVLSKLRHLSLPYVEKKIMINDFQAIIMREISGITMPDLLNQYPSGIPAEHVMWMLERIFSVVGYLHSNFVIHGNIKPENIIITKENHNVSLVGFSFCIPNANTKDAKYMIVNDYYTAPEVNKSAQVLPSSDIYSIGKVAIKLLGGDIASNGMPIGIDARIRTFIRKLVTTDVSNRPNDAWKLWDELIALRTKIYGTKRFKEFN